MAEHHHNHEECCEEHIIHKDLVEQSTINMPDEDEMMDLAELFKVFGDTTRIRILYALYDTELCVCDIATLLNMNQSAISHQLRIIKTAGLVKNRRDGKSIFYSLADDHVKTILGQGIEHVME